MGKDMRQVQFISGQKSDNNVTQKTILTQDFLQVSIIHYAISFPAKFPMLKFSQFLEILLTIVNEEEI